MANLDLGISDNQAIQGANAAGISLISAQNYYLNTPKQGKFIFGYSQLEKERITEGIEKLFHALSSGMATKPAIESARH